MQLKGTKMAETGTPAKDAARTSVTDTSYVSTGNNAAFARLIKDAAIYRYEVGADVGTLGESWTPGSSKLPFGYFSEDGIVIHPESGDSDDFKAHNGDVVASVSSGGYWTFAFAALESKKDVLETYFDAAIDANGALTVTGADITKYAQYVIAGITQNGNLIIIHVPKAQISDREDVEWKITDLMKFGMTLRTYKGGTDTPYMWKAWGMSEDITPAA